MRLSANCPTNFRPASVLCPCFIRSLSLHRRLRFRFRSPMRRLDVQLGYVMRPSRPITPSLRSALARSTPVGSETPIRAQGTCSGEHAGDGAAAPKERRAAARQGLSVEKRKGAAAPIGAAHRRGAASRRQQQQPAVCFALPYLGSTGWPARPLRSVVFGRPSNVPRRGEAGQPRRRTGFIRLDLRPGLKRSGEARELAFCTRPCRRCRRTRCAVPCSHQQAVQDLPVSWFSQ